MENYFGNDKYSQIVKNKLEQYRRLVEQNKLTETEEDLLILRDYLEEVPDYLAMELKAQFLEIESKRNRNR